MCNLTISLQATDAKLLFQQLSFPALEKHGDPVRVSPEARFSKMLMAQGGSKMDSIHHWPPVCLWGAQTHQKEKLNTRTLWPPKWSSGCLSPHPNLSDIRFSGEVLRCVDCGVHPGIPKPKHPWVDPRSRFGSRPSQGASLMPDARLGNSAVFHVSTACETSSGARNT